MARKEKEPIRTLFVTHAAEFGGAELSLLELLEALDRRRVSAMLLSYSAGPLVDAAAGLGVHVHVMDAGAGVLSVRRADFAAGPAGIARALRGVANSQPIIRDTAAHIRKSGAQLVYSNTAKAHVLAGLAARRARTPVIWHARDYFSKPSVRLFYKTLTRYVPDAIVCNSEFTAAQFKEAGRCRVIPNGLPEDKILPKRSAREARAEFGLTEGSPCAGVAGRIYRKKGIATFLKAAAIVLKRFPDARFFIVGGTFYKAPEYPEELKRLSAALGISDRVIFTGFRADIYDLMNMFDAYVLPSEEPETFGRGIVESMFLGKPVIVSAHGGPLEVVADGETGMLFKPGSEKELAEKMILIFSDKEKAAAMGAAGRERAKELFTIQRCAREIEDVIERTTAGEKFNTEGTGAQRTQRKKKKQN